MVSRRTWATISTMMAVLLFLFFFSGVMKDTWNEYDVNSYYKVPKISASDAWHMDQDTGEEMAGALAGDMSGRNIVLIGGENKDLCNIVEQWCAYTKRSLDKYTSLQQYHLSEDNKPKLILLDPDNLNLNTDIIMLQTWVKKGVNLVFCSLPEPATIKKYKKLAMITGIKAVYSESVAVNGVEFFGGFLLGGDTIYEAQNENEEKRQDFDLEIPWYQTTSGIKTYAVGLMDRDKVENEFMPGIIWRKSIGDSRIFVINGNFMSYTEGIGILSAIVTECSEYDLYPIVNAQNLSIINFPGFSDENEQEMMDIYSRSQTGIYEDIIWPALLATMGKSGNKLTCFISPQFDYSDETEPLVQEYIYQFKKINEIRGEAGMSTSRSGGISVEEKLKNDMEFFKKQASRYQFSSYYASKEDLNDAAMLQQTDAAQDMTTITTDYAEGELLISFLTEDVTLQRATIDGFSHTFREDMRVRSIETALGYSNIAADFHRIFWPEDENDRFEKLAEEFSSYTNTYWARFQCFDHTTLSESDERVRTFLALDYAFERDGDTIDLNIKNIEGSSWFILRTHGEEVYHVSGGSYTVIETNVYMIQADKKHVEIRLREPEDEKFYYLEKPEKGDDGE